MKSFLIYLIAILTFGPLYTPPAAAQTPPAQEMPVLLPDPLIPGRYKTTCPGVGGRIYTFQISTNGTVWTYLDLVKLGVTGTAIEYGFTPISGGRSFFRLKYTIANTYTSGGDGDIDGDSISNQDEVSYFVTDPFVSDDTDGDGYLNADETAAGTDLNSATSKPFDPASPPPANRYVVPLAWWVENKFADTIEALTVRNQLNDITAFRDKAIAMADGSYDLPYLTIQAAVNSAVAGDVILVAPGTYQESVDLTGKNVKLMGQRGSREETVIELFSADDPATTTANDPIRRPYGLKVGAGNTSATVVSGITIQNAAYNIPAQTGGTAVLGGGGSEARLHNLWAKNCGTGVVVENASLLLLNVVVDGSTGSAATDAGLRITGTSNVRSVGCTFADNVPGNTTDGQVQVVGSAAALTMVNSIVTNAGASSRPGGQIRLTSGGTANVSYSSIRTGFTGPGNITSQNPADPAAPYFDMDAVSGGQRRLLKTCECVDRGNPAGLPGFSYWSRLDSDGEARGRAYGLAARASKADIGADEYVSRLKFATKTRNERNTTKTYSEVDEASDVAFLGVLPNGNTKIAIINDETIKDTAGLEFNNITFHEISAVTGEIVPPAPIPPLTVSVTETYPLNRSGSSGSIPSGAQFKDPEGIAYDPVNRKLYVTTSMTKVNRYRDCETSTYDPLIDPPSNEYDPRRCAVVCVQLDTAANNFAPLSKTYTDSNDGSWVPPAQAANRRDMDGFVAGSTATSPVGFDSPSGLVAHLRNALSANTALTASTKNTGVLIAISTSPKFGKPVNGTTYLPGQALPYSNTAGLGGPSATGGFILAVPGTPASAAFPYWTLATLPAAGQLITGYQTSAGGALTALTTGTTYYFKAWAYDAAKNYGRGLESSVKVSTVPPVSINEFQAAPTDVVELFNRSGQSVAVGDYYITDEQDRFNTKVPAGTVIPARSYFRFNLSLFGLADGINTSGSAKSDNVRLYVGTATSSAYGPEVDNYQKYTRLQVSGMGEGRVWDGGPRGKSFDFSGTTGFEAVGAVYKTGGSHQQTLGDPSVAGSVLNNSTSELDPVKFFQAGTNHLTGTGIYLHYTNLGSEPAVWRYSPKQQDFHPISVEGMAVKSQTEIVVGLRSPLTNRTTGNAYAFVFSNTGNAMLPTAGWVAPAPGQPAIPSQQGLPRELNLNGQGIRSVQWCPGLRNVADVAGSPATGAYLIVGGASNGGPLKNETTRQKFSLYRWDNTNVQPVKVVDDLSGFAVRPEGVNVITLNGQLRVIFVEDRFKAEGYDTQNSVHWPLSALNLQ